ncbi:hypothetical protein ACSUZJ_11270 [Telluria sp. B2]
MAQVTAASSTQTNREARCVTFDRYRLKGWSRTKLISSALGEIALRQLHDGDPFSTLQIIECAQFWFSRARDNEQRAAAQILVAKSWIAQADKDGSSISRQHCYAKSIAELCARPPTAGMDIM